MNKKYQEAFVDFTGSLINKECKAKYCIYYNSDEEKFHDCPELIRYRIIKGEYFVECKEDKGE